MSAVVALRPWRSWDTGNRDVSCGGSMTMAVLGHRQQGCQQWWLYDHGGPRTQVTGMSAVVALRPWRSQDTGNRDVSSGGSTTLEVLGHR